MGQNVWVQSPERWKFFIFLNFVVPLLYVAGILNVAGAAAAAITAEHEDDTWTSLTATDLTAWEIVLAKLAGALWRPRLYLIVILLLVMAGTAVGSLHPLSLAPLCLALFIYGWFTAALGICISLQLRSTWRAQFLTTSVFLLFNLSGQAVLSNVKQWAPLMWPGFTPYELSKTLLSANFIREWGDYSSLARGPLPEMDYGPLWSTIFAGLSLACYLGGAIVLTLFAAHQFDRVAGRAHRPLLPRQVPVPGKPAAHLEPAISE
jgi:ABC-type transport system involved in multi-copper enzyme maturation permease subunit